MIKYSRCREINALVRCLVHGGWTFRWGGKHGKLSPPNDQRFVTVPTTPSDSRAARNFVRELRRLGAKH